jgi:hypothetical protein
VDVRLSLDPDRDPLKPGTAFFRKDMGDDRMKDQIRDKVSIDCALGGMPG